MFEFQGRQQLCLAEHFCPYEVDVPHTRILAFVNVDLDLHAIAAELLDGGLDAGAVAPLGEVRACEFNADALQGDLLEDVALLQARLA